MSEKSFESRILDGHGDASLLCQPDGERGCGGCCTNFSQPRHILERVFSVRKEAYDAWVQSEDDMLLYRKKMDLMERGTRQCRFLSFSTRSIFLSRYRRSNRHYRIGIYIQ